MNLLLRLLTKHLKERISYGQQIYKSFIDENRNLNAWKVDFNGKTK